MAATLPQAIVTSFPGGVALDWPEPVQRVQSLVSTGLTSLPAQYVRPELERPSPKESLLEDELQIPIIDLAGLQDESARGMTLAAMEHACEEWGFFQIINHGVSFPLLQRVKMVSRQFFELPMEEKLVYANNPSTYEGYGSRVGVEKAAILDWGDYFYLNVLPTAIRDMKKCPTKPALWRETMDEYSQHILKLSQELLAAFCCSLNLDPSALKEAFGGDAGYSMALRVNFYPPCPQPDLTLGLSPHSDPGGITFLLQDDQIEGLQVRHNRRWVTVKPIPGGLVVNLADQLQILTNGKYRSVEHRAIVNHYKERFSIAAFCNPANELVVGPLKELVGDVAAPRYKSMTFREYRSFVRRRGAKGKEVLESISSTSS